MKKLLLSATALTMLAGAAAAEVTLSGDARFGIVYDDGGLAAGANAGNTEVRQRVRVFFNMTTETDSGVTFGARIGLDTRTEDALATGANGVDDTVGVVSDNAGSFRQLHPVITASVSGFDFKLGNTNGAVIDKVGLWSGGLGFDGSLGRPAIVSGFDGDENGNQTIYLGYTFGDFSVAVSTTVGGSEADDVEFAAKYSANGISVSAGADDDDNWAVGASYSSGAFGVGALYRGGAIDAWRVYGTYTMGATTIGINATDDGSGGDTAFGIGVTQDLGGGVKVVGAVGTDPAGDTNAQLGITIGF